MAFLLGSFTDGLFGGAKDVMSIANEWEGLKQKRMLNKAAEDAMAATKDQQRLDKEAKDNWSPRGQNTSTASDPEKYTEPDFSSLPAPKFMSDKVTKEALPLLPKASPDNPSEGKARLSPSASKSALATTPDAPAERVPFVSPEGLIKQGIGAAARLGYGARQALIGGGAQAAPAAEAPIPPAPAYLPPQQPATPSVPPGLRLERHIGPGTTDILEQHSALPVGTPNLASNQIGLGPRILAALNPAAGSTG